MSNPILTGTLYLNHNDYGKLYSSASHNLSNLDLNLFSDDGLSITSAGSEFQSFITLWLKTDCLIPNLAGFYLPAVSSGLNSVCLIPSTNFIIVIVLVES